MYIKLCFFHTLLFGDPFCIEKTPIVNWIRLREPLKQVLSRVHFPNEGLTKWTINKIMSSNHPDPSKWG